MLGGRPSAFYRFDLIKINYAAGPGCSPKGEEMMHRAEGFSISPTPLKCIFSLTLSFPQKSKRRRVMWG